MYLLGQQFGTLPTSVTAIEYFPERKSVVSGIVSMAAGLGPYVFTYVCQGIVSIDDMSKDKDGFFVQAEQISKNV